MPNPKVLAINDLSGFGTTSLLAVIPIMNRMGIEVVTMPSALLSANTDFPDYVLQDNSVLLKKSLQHWQKLQLTFDAIYTGFLGSPLQVSVLLENLLPLKNDKTLVLVDPVLADAGKLYSCYTWEMVEAMRSLISISDIITPNWTEAIFLTDFHYGQNSNGNQVQECCEKLAALGPRYVVITSAPNAKGEFSSVALFDARLGFFQEFACQYAPVVFPGAGDCFSAMLLAGLLNGYDLVTSIQGTLSFLQQAIEKSITTVVDRKTGIDLISALKTDPQLFFSH
ncbi:MAG: pyridoxamine kinase [Candidatus Cloacimonas sp.]